LFAARWSRPAQAKGRSVVMLGASTEADFDPAFAMLSKAEAGALVVISDPHTQRADVGTGAVFVDARHGFERGKRLWPVLTADRVRAIFDRDVELQLFRGIDDARRRV
jgi:hypothetical protein